MKEEKNFAFMREISSRVKEFRTILSTAFTRLVASFLSYLASIHRVLGVSMKSKLL